MKRLRAKSAIPDGEVVMRPDGIFDFGKLQDAISEGRSDPMTFWAFDLVVLDGRSLASEPLEARKAKVEKLLKRLPRESPIRYSEHVVANGPKF